MIALRSAAFLAILIAFTPFYCALVMLSGPFSRRTRYRVIIGWNRIALWLIQRLLGIEHEVRGLENIPREPCVILSKHQSAWETIAYSWIFPPHVYVIKRELLWIPFLGWGLGLMSPIAINRAQRKEAMQRLIELGGERLEQGFSIMVYPEGTRVAVGRRGIYKLGGAVIAVNNRAKVLPVAHNAGLVWPRKSFRKYPGKVTVVIGPAIDAAGLTPEQVMRRVEDWIEREMERLTPPEAIGKPPGSLALATPLDRGANPAGLARLDNALDRGAGPAAPLDKGA
jgi:1-acyl-sn-glycerol-3-phosphate acyltransferase